MDRIDVAYFQTSENFIIFGKLPPRYEKHELNERRWREYFSPRNQCHPLSSPSDIHLLTLMWKLKVRLGTKERIKFGKKIKPKSS